MNRTQMIRDGLITILLFATSMGIMRSRTKNEIRKTNNQIKEINISDHYDEKNIVGYKRFFNDYDSNKTTETTNINDPANCWNLQKINIYKDEKNKNSKDTTIIKPFDENRNMYIERFYDTNENIILTIRRIDTDNDGNYNCIDSIVAGEKDENGLLINDIIKRVWIDRTPYKIVYGLREHIYSKHSKMHLQDIEPDLRPRE